MDFQREDENPCFASDSIGRNKRGKRIAQSSSPATSVGRGLGFLVMDPLSLRVTIFDWIYCQLSSAIKKTCSHEYYTYFLIGDGLGVACRGDLAIGSSAAY